jgi:hypothetical protein
MTLSPRKGSLKALEDVSPDHRRTQVVQRTSINEVSGEKDSDNDSERVSHLSLIDENIANEIVFKTTGSITIQPS